MYNALSSWSLFSEKKYLVKVCDSLRIVRGRMLKNDAFASNSEWCRNNTLSGRTKNNSEVVVQLFTVVPYGSSFWWNKRNDGKIQNLHSLFRETFNFNHPKKLREWLLCYKLKKEMHAPSSTQRCRRRRKCMKRKWSQRRFGAAKHDARDSIEANAGRTNGNVLLTEK